MADSVTKVTRTSWGDRMKNSFLGIIVGLILIFLSGILLFNNEGRAVKTAKGLTEGSKAVVSVSNTPLDPANENKLVHLYGALEVEDTLRDAEFHLAVNALHLNREVEMYQWTEDQETKTEDKLGGAQETTTTYTYKKAWKSSEVNSSEFQEPSGHENPGSFPYQKLNQSAQMVTLGDFQLSSSLISSVNQFTDIQPQEQNIAQVSGASLSGKYVHIGKGSANEPKVGDVRISFKKVVPTEVSIIAQQMGNRLTPYLTSQGTHIELLQLGSVPANMMFEAAQSQNTVLTWILRLVGVVLMFIGFKLFFGPISILTAVLPFLKKIADIGIGLVSFILALSISLLIIAIGWLFYRPVLAIVLIVIAVGGFLLISQLRKKQGA